MKKGDRIKFSFAGQELEGFYIGEGQLNDDTKVLKVECDEGYIYPIRKSALL